LRRLFPTILSCDIASPYSFMTIIQELRTRLGVSRTDLPFQSASNCSMSDIGIFETCRRTLKMSAGRGEPEILGAR
jgi:hypothetical protein